MKRIILKIMLMSFFLVEGSQCGAQGFFNQKGAWIKNQLKQIALFEVYIKDLEKGYDIARHGLNTIGDIKNGDFHLHLARFNALIEVTPRIKEYSAAIKILLVQADIKKLYTKTDDDYIRAVFNRLMDGCQADIEQFNCLLSADSYKMTDDERINNIDKLYADMKDKYAFAKSFSNTIKILSLQKRKAQKEVFTSRLLNNIKIP